MAENLRQTAYSISVQDVVERIDTDLENGLDEADAQRRIASFGPNRLRRRTKKSTLSILAHQFRSIIVWLLSGAAIMSFILDDVPEGLAIVGVLMLNAAIGFFTEYKAARSMEALMRIAEVRTRVRRGGTDRMIDAHQLVPGDLVILEAGDVVTADLRLTEASNLQTDESVLTGESVPVIKTTEATMGNVVLGDRVGMAFKGTGITQGAGEGIVIATGMDTELGRISDLAQSAEGEAAPLERRLDALGHRLVWLTLALAILTIGAGILRGHDFEIMVRTGVALAVAAVPEGLPVVATLSLARGMWRMSKRNALITRLSSVETLGATTVVLTDKTGTLTENRMTVVRYLLANADLNIERVAGKACFDPAVSALGADTDTPLAWALRIGVLCSNAEWTEASTNASTGDPMEIALLSMAGSAGIGRQALLEEYPEVREHAFDPTTKMMATVHEAGEGFVFAVKGAPEAVVADCTHVLAPGGVRDLDDDLRLDWNIRISDAAKDGLRLLALAMKRDTAADAAPYGGLTLVGLVGLMDPIRKGVPEAISASRAAGVRVVMLTGDYAVTAATIARKANLGDGEIMVIESGELADLDADTASEDLRQRILSADVFARVAPETKLTLVTFFQRAGHVVAMTGDGVNDAPALRKADIGIAMGQRGTQVAKEAAHMVLQDDKFETIIFAMRQGRVIFDNIRKFVVYLMSCNVSEVLVVGIAIGAGLPTPLLPLQILFLNLVTDVFPAFALGLGKGDENVMTKPPRDPAISILDRPRWVLIGVLGGIITLMTLGAFVLALYALQLDVGASVTVAFLTLALAQLWNVFNVRDRNSRVFSNEVTHNPYVWGAIMLCLGLIGLALWFQPLADLLGLPNPGLSGFMLAGGASLATLVFGQAWIRFAEPRLAENAEEHNAKR